MENDILRFNTPLSGGSPLKNGSHCTDYLRAFSFFRFQGILCLSRRMSAVREIHFRVRFSITSLFESRNKHRIGRVSRMILKQYGYLQIGPLLLVFRCYRSKYKKNQITRRMMEKTMKRVVFRQSLLYYITRNTVTELKLKYNLNIFKLL